MSTDLEGFLQSLVGGIALAVAIAQGGIREWRDGTRERSVTGFVGICLVPIVEGDIVDYAMARLGEKKSRREIVKRFKEIGVNPAMIRKEKR
jgi:hypothetical protein